MNSPAFVFFDIGLTLLSPRGAAAYQEVLRDLGFQVRLKTCLAHYRQDRTTSKQSGIATAAPPRHRDPFWPCQRDAALAYHAKDKMPVPRLCR